MGWGKFAGKNSFEIPLSQLHSSFSSRPVSSDNTKLGVSPSYDQWFRGDATIFGGIEHSITSVRGLNLKLEYDPFDSVSYTHLTLPTKVRV